MTPSRQRWVDALKSRKHCSVLIVGAGINGAGLFRELALQDIDVTLIDRNDFCAGASAAPSRLIHGGLKYLETGEFRLVAESALERNLLLRNAPHYVKPLRTAVPIRSWFGGILPSVKRFLGRPAKLHDRGLLITELGMALYDFFGRHHRSMPRHHMALKRKTRARFPDIRPDIIATATYYDATVTQPERLNYELIADALRESDQAVALNYMALESRQANTITLRDTLSGDRHHLEADIVINAGGAWIDRINHALGHPTHYIGGTKGSHLILEHPDLARQLDGGMVYFGTEDGRICLAYPFLGNVLIGSTDLPCDDPDTASCDEDELEYMLNAVQELFPTLTIERSQVRYRYSGVRPLPASDADNPGEVSRDHSIQEDDLDGGPTVLSLIGGKWTTFRGFSEEVGNRVLTLQHRQRTCTTRDRPIGGGRQFPSVDSQYGWCKRLADANDIALDRARTLLQRYGTQAESVASWCHRHPDRALQSLPDYTEQELIHLCEQECVGTLADILFRRLPIALSGRLTAEVIHEVADVMARHLGWSEEYRNDVGERTLALAAQHHGISRRPPATYRQTTQSVS
ncbi:glycerol-3-phosphate dehydrogenase/oxidase [Aidingimonas halophila]|uniref:Glycerol-3-phosphate dehydrogenase n=1 Tax=Aidingimonas halophila TaxID=574349 RepID=A0A1H3FSA0_9GAMM|nr:glycerol-3-phosphate dehydrogenase/oxidase [Aidingimonas halophila]GHC38427.1 glycerol-3-phosphate dehydrogenase [Aidingimonas halophila]SDX93943.1 glycerol-3-phosphate dehydrogenase [Aidingimonas halophila]